MLYWLCYSLNGELAVAMQFCEKSVGGLTALLTIRAKICITGDDVGCCRTLAHRQHESGKKTTGLRRFTMAIAESQRTTA